MNSLSLAASSVLVCALAAADLTVHPASSPAALPAEDAATVLIRYDPDAVFLTHELVAPLCAREVELTDDSVDWPVGKLVMDAMKSNDLQPRGVFVGRVRIDWAAGVDLSAERRDELLDDGLDQLRSALAGRLVQPRRDQLVRRVQVLEVMEDELKVTAAAKARELARRNDLLASNDQLEAVSAAMRARALERRAAQQELLIATTKVQEVEARVQTGNVTVDRVRADLERLRDLVAQGVSSQLDLRAAEGKLAAATNDLQVAKVQVDSQRMKVEQRRAQLEAAEVELDSLEKKVMNLQDRVAQLSSEEGEDAETSLQVGHTADNGRLTELGAELQRARAALATIPDVTVERW